MFANSFRVLFGALLLSLLVTGVRAEEKPAVPTPAVPPVAAPVVAAPATPAAPAAAHAAVAGPKLVIVKAVYGDLPDGTKADVTDKVKTFVKDDALSVGATNDNFGDPVEGTVKKLRVEYTFAGEKKSKEAAENETLTITDKGE